MSNQIHSDHNFINSINSILVDGTPIHNVQLEGYLESLYMLFGDVKGGGPYPPFYGSVQPGPGYTVTYSTDMVLLAFKHMLGTTTSGFLGALTDEMNKYGTKANKGIQDLYSILTKQPLGKPSLISLFQESWSTGLPHDLAIQLTQSNSPLAQLINNVNTEYNRGLEKNYQPPADLKGELAGIISAVGSDISSGNVTNLVGDLETIKSVLTNASYADDPFVQALQGIFTNSDATQFNPTNSIVGDSKTYTGTADKPYMTISQLADLVAANPTDVKLAANFLALFSGKMPGAGSANPNDPNATWATLFTDTSSTGLGNFLASYGF